MEREARETNAGRSRSAPQAVVGVRKSCGTTPCKGIACRIEEGAKKIPRNNPMQRRAGSHARKTWTLTARSRAPRASPSAGRRTETAACRVGLVGMVISFSQETPNRVLDGPEPILRFRRAILCGGSPLLGVDACGFDGDDPRVGLPEVLLRSFELPLVLGCFGFG